MEQNSSYEYSPGKKLGKRSDQAAVFWKAAAGDDYRITVMAFASDGTTELAMGVGDTITLWRKVLFTQVSSMDGETYLDTGTTQLSDYPGADPAKQNAA